MQQTTSGVVVVSGAARRLGAALVRALLAQGYPVIASYRTLTDEVAALQAKGALMLPADLASDEGAERFAAAIKKHASSIRAMIHNASLWHSDRAMADNSALRDASYALHVFTPHYLNQTLAPLLLAHQGLRDMVFISDASVGSDLGKADKALYLASKAAMESVMRSHAQQFAPDIKVNAIAPGLLAFQPNDDADYQALRLSQSLLKFEPGFGVAIDAVDYVLNSPYTTGSVLTLDGGRRCS